MPSLKDLRGRIKSVKNTRQITKTMKMVAAAKVRRARNKVEAARPYADRLQQVLANLVAGNKSNASFMLTGREDVQTVRLIVCSADRGLCGGFNANLFKAVRQFIEAHTAKKQKVQIVVVGRKLRDLIKRFDVSLLVGEHVDVTRNITFSFASDLAAEAVTAFEAGSAADGCDEVYVLYSACVSMLTQTPTVERLLPFGAYAESDSFIDVQTTVDALEGEESKAGALTASLSYEPDEATILADLLPRNVKTQLYRALLESAASEQAARMTAMDNATRNAGDMIKSLNLEYNRSRQAAITKELIEIISGAQAV